MQDLIQMLNEYEIKNIISVDDNWFVSEGFVAKIVAQGVGKNMSIKDYCASYAIDIDDTERECFDELSDFPLKDLEVTGYKIPKTFAVICDNLNVDIDASLKTLKSILDYLQEQEKFRVYRGVEFETSYQQLDGNTLYILDKDMGENRQNEFLDYIFSITSKRKMYNDLVIVYSNEVSQLLNHDAKVQYLEENNKRGDDLAVLYQFWPLSKVTDETLLISEIKQMISKSMYGKALSKMIETKKVSIEKAFKDLLKVNIDSLDDMIIESYIEGGKLTESYDLLIDSLIRRSTLEQILTSNVLVYEKDLLRYEEKRAKEILLEKEIDSSNKYNKFQNASRKKKVIDSVSKEIMLFNIADYSVNKEYNNPMMGDVYIFTEARSNKKCAGMLISQECSTVIRKGNFSEKPRRTANDLLLLIFDIVEISEENLVDRIISKLDNCIWPVKIDGKVCLLENTKKTMYVNSEVLDLCGLNADGKANVQYDEKAIEYKGVYSQEYYKDFKMYIKQKIEDVTNQVKQGNGIKRKDNNVENMIVSLAFGIVYKENFELQRICRVDEKHTLHIIHEYLNGIGKIGLPVVPNLQS